jgi:hypothetical protein
MVCVVAVEGVITVELGMVGMVARGCWKLLVADRQTTSPSKRIQSTSRKRIKNAIKSSRIASQCI